MHIVHSLLLSLSLEVGNRKKLTSLASVLLHDQWVSFYFQETNDLNEHLYCRRRRQDIRLTSLN